MSDTFDRNADEALAEWDQNLEAAQEHFDESLFGRPGERGVVSPVTLALADERAQRLEQERSGYEQPDLFGRGF